MPGCAWQGQSHIPEAGWPRQALTHLAGEQDAPSPTWGGRCCHGVMQSLVLHSWSRHTPCAQSWTCCRSCGSPPRTRGALEPQCWGPNKGSPPALGQQGLGIPRTSTPGVSQMVQAGPGMPCCTLPEGTEQSRAGWLVPTELAAVPHTGQGAVPRSRQAAGGILQAELAVLHCARAADSDPCSPPCCTSQQGCAGLPSPPCHVPLAWPCTGRSVAGPWQPVCRQDTALSSAG